MHNWFLLVLLLLSPVYAGDCSTVLVGVMDTPDGFEGVAANLTVSVIPGNGNVWVDTMPLTQIDTQVSARLAREVSCELLGIDCSNFDFFYVIRSDFVMVGGPSAGAPMTVCTLASLLNKTLKSRVAMTGTINPDASVGSVGSVLVKASILDDYDLFLVPEGTNVDNISINTVEVDSIIDAFRYYTDYELVLGNVSSEAVVSSDYTSAMQMMDESLLSIAYNLLNGTEAEGLFNDSKRFYDNGSYYSSASYSVRSLISSISVRNSVLNNDELKLLIINISELLASFKGSFLANVSFDHLYDFESFFITMDRINEAEDLLISANETIGDESLFYVSYAETRLITAIEWSKLLGYFSDSKVIDFDVSVIRPLIIERIGSARNSIAYAKTLVDSYHLSSADEHLDNAINAYASGELTYSLFESLKARAEANLFMDLRGVNNLSLRVSDKCDTAIRAISNSMIKGYLPLLSLSYLEYSESFINDPYQAILFLAYSKEFASLSSSINELVKYYDDGSASVYYLTKSLDFSFVNYFLFIILGFLIALIIILR